MKTPCFVNTSGMGPVLRVAAVVLFILAAVFLFFIDTITVKTDLGLVSAGLACWAAEGLVGFIPRQ